MCTHDLSFGTLTDNYPQEHTRCLPPKAIARFGRGGVSAVTTSPDGTLVAVLSRIGVWLYDAHTDDFVALIAVEGTGVLGRIAFSPDGTQIAVGDWDGKVTLWEIETGTMLNAITHHQAHITALAFSPDGSLLATGSRDKTVKLWDVETEENCWTVTCEKSVESIAFSPDSRYVATRLPGFVNIRNVDDGTSAPAVIHKQQWVNISKRNPPPQHSQNSASWIVTFSLDGKHLAGLDGDHSLTLWDVGTGAEARNFERVTKHGAWTTMFRGRTVVCSSKGFYLVIGFCGTGQDTVRLWREGTIMDFIPEAPVISAAISPDGQLLATGGWDRTVTLWNVETQTAYCTLKGHTAEIYALAFSDDGKFLVSGGADNWNEYQEGIDGNTNHPEGNCLVWSKEGVLHYFYADENHIDKTAKVWEVATGKNIATLENPSQVREVAFSHDSTRLAIASERHVSLWCTKTWKNIATLDVKKVESLSFSPDGTRIATGGTWPEQTIRLCDVETGERIAEFSGRKRNVSSLTFSLDGRLLASGSFDGTILLWDMKPYL